MGSRNGGRAEEKALGYDKNGYYDKQSSLLCIFYPLPARAFSSFILHLFFVEKDNYCLFFLTYLTLSISFP